MPRKYISPISTAIFFDFDGVLHASLEPDAKGFAGGQLINPDAIKSILSYSIKKNIPLYVITARADNEIQRNHIINLLSSIEGITSGVGGFKKENIYCLGIEHKNKQKKSILIGLRISKLQKIMEIHKKELGHLKETDLLFVDDDLTNINPVLNAGYVTIRAFEDNLYFEEIMEFIRNKLSTNFLASAHEPKNLNKLFFASITLEEQKPVSWDNKIKF